MSETSSIEKNEHAALIVLRQQFGYLIDAAVQVSDGVIGIRLMSVFMVKSKVCAWGMQGMDAGHAPCNGQISWI